MLNVKSSDKADVLRAEGNQFYAQKRFYDALLKYNESLCFAEVESENLGLAFANRSAVYFEMRLYDKCLENVEMARQNRYPEKNAEILKKREEKCLEMMKLTTRDESRSSDPWSFFKLSHPANPKLPLIADCLELRTDKKYGRHIITTRSLKVGDIIAIDEPFCKIIQEDFVHQRCTGCFKDDLLSLMPCPNCRKAMFCKKCIRQSTLSFHVYECSLAEIFFSSLFTSSMKMALRTFFVALKLFNGSIDKLESFINENTNSRTVFDCKESDDPKEKLLAVHSLISSDSIEVNERVFEEVFIADQSLKSLWKTQSSFIRKFLKKQTQIGTLNYHEIYAWPLKRGGLSDPDIENFKGALAYKRGVVSTGNGSYPLLSLLNHSCSPNVVRICIDDKICLITTRSINQGEQIFDNYGFNFTNMPKDHRQQELLTHYKFKCNCLACTKDWPLLPALKVFDKAIFNKAKKSSRELSLAGINQRKSIEKYRELCAIIEGAKKVFPSMEICSIMESAAAYLEMIFKPNQFS